MARVLLVEDHDRLHRLLCDLLGQDHTADCVTTKAEAMALLAPDSHDLVIANARLPDDSGYEVAAHAERLGARAIVMRERTDEIRAMTISGMTHLAVPFGTDEFRQIVSQLLTAKLLGAHTHPTGPSLSARILRRASGRSVLA